MIESAQLNDDLSYADYLITEAESSMDIFIQNGKLDKDVLLKNEKLEASYNEAVAVIFSKHQELIKQNNESQFCNLK